MKNFEVLKNWLPAGYSHKQIIILRDTKAAARIFSVKQVFLEISQNSLENTCTRVSFLTKLQAWRETFGNSLHILLQC